MSGQLKMRHDGMIYDANNGPVRHNWGESEKKKKVALDRKTADKRRRAQLARPSAAIESAVSDVISRLCC